MNKAELVSRLTKRVGVPEADIKIFLEVLLNKITEILNTGDSAEIEGIGTFYFIKGELIKKNTNLELNRDTVVDLIVYSPFNLFDPSSDENLIFNIPNSSFGSYSEVDSLFTLSAGKPIIPLEQNPDSNLFVPRSEVEMWRLVESKVDKVLSEAVVSREIIDPGNFIKLNENDFKKENSNWYEHHNGLREKEINNLLDNGSTEKSDPEKLPWDFGIKNLGHSNDTFFSNQKYIESEVNPDEKENKNSDNNSEKPSGYDQGTSWDFGGSEFKIKLIEKNKTLLKDEESNNRRGSSLNENNMQDDDSLYKEDDNHEYFELNKLRPENEPENSIDINFSQEDFEIPKYEAKEDEKIGNFQRVKSLISEIGENDLNKHAVNKITWETNENIPDDSEKSAGKTKNEFVRVQSKTTEFGYDSEDLKDLDNKKYKKIEPPEMANKYGESQNTEPAIEGTNSMKILKDLEGSDGPEDLEYQKEPEDKDDAIQEAIDFVNKKRDMADEFTESGRKKGFIIAVSIFAVIIIVVLVLMKFGPNLQPTASEQKANKLHQPSFQSVIGRSYDVPVEYPYTPNEAAFKSNFDEISPSVYQVKKGSSTGQPNSTEVNSQKTKQVNKDIGKQPVVSDTKVTAKDKPDNANLEGIKVELNIYKYGNYFVVQTSSWPNREKAEDQVKMYKDRGLNSFIEKAQIPGRGTWYRVKVGNFKTLDQARNFVNRNQ